MLDVATTPRPSTEWRRWWHRWRADGPRAVLLPVQLFLAAGWARAGVEKVIDRRWWDGQVLLDYLARQRPHMLPFFMWFTDLAVVPLAAVVAGGVMVAQLAIAGCLAANRCLRPALWCGVVLNVAFTLAGSVNPSAFYLVMELVLLFTLSRVVPMVIATRRATAWLMLAAFILPFARTLHPAEVIEDPALMLAFVAGLAAVTGVAMTADRDVRAPDVTASSGSWHGAARSRDPRD